MVSIPIQRLQPPLEFNLEQREGETDAAFQSRINALEAQCKRTKYAYIIRYKGVNLEGETNHSVDFIYLP